MQRHRQLASVLHLLPVRSAPMKEFFGRSAGDPLALKANIDNCPGIEHVLTPQEPLKAASAIHQSFFFGRQPGSLVPSRSKLVLDALADQVIQRLHGLVAVAGHAGFPGLRIVAVHGEGH